MYRTQFIDPDYRKEPQTSCYCGRCQKDLKPDQPRRWIHLVDGGPFALHSEDEGKYISDSGDLYWFPVGMDCAKKIGLEFTHEKQP